VRLSTSAKVSLVSNAVALLAVALAWWGWPASAPLPYAVHKTLHLVGVVVFMGNLIAGPVWFAFAFLADDRPAIAFAARSIAAADIVLTAPGIQLTVWNGVCLAAAMGGLRAQPWLVESVLLLVGTSLFASLVVLPAQERFVEAAQGDDRARLLRAIVMWSLWGTLVSVPFAVIAWLMVSKQALLH
jgi:uncharacterized membrane protein